MMVSGFRRFGSLFVASTSAHATLTLGCGFCSHMHGTAPLFGLALAARSVGWRAFLEPSAVVATQYRYRPWKKGGVVTGKYRKPVVQPRHKWDWRALDGKEYTDEPLRVPQLGGRDPKTGRKVNQRIGGGVKHDYLWVSYDRRGPAEEGTFYEERVLEIRKDPNRTALIAKVAGTKGRRWIIASENMQPGQILKTTSFVSHLPVKPEEGNAYPVGSLPLGTLVHGFEVKPGGPRRVGSAGCAATVGRKMGELVIVELPSKKEIAVKPECMATVGRVSNVDHKDIDIGSANEARRRGRKQKSGFWQRKTGYLGRKMKPLPPIKPYDGLEPPADEYVTMTLEKRQLNAIFGPGSLDQLRHA